MESSLSLSKQLAITQVKQAAQKMTREQAIENLISITTLYYGTLQTITNIASQGETVVLPEGHGDDVVSSILE